MHGRSKSKEINANQHNPLRNSQSVFIPPTESTSAFTRKLWGARSTVPAHQAPDELLVHAPSTTSQHSRQYAMETSGGGGEEGAVHSPKSFTSPLFHLTAQDASIVAIEHNNHSKLLATATSAREVYVTLTQAMPTIEDQAAARRVRPGEEEDAFSRAATQIDDRRAQSWDPVGASMLVDRLRAPCSQMLWAPWQHGVFLAVLCPELCVRVYRYSHGRWGLDAEVAVPSGIAMASSFFGLSVACRGGKIMLFSRGTATGEDGVSVWTNSTYTPGEEDRECTYCYSWPGRDAEELLPPSSSAQSRSDLDGGSAAGGAPSRGSRPQPSSSSRDCLCVSSDDSGTLLAAGDGGGTVRIFCVTGEGTRIGSRVFTMDAGGRSCGSCRQVAWAPSSGRSFLALAAVFTNTITVVLFRRPQHLRLPETTALPISRSAGGSNNSAAAAAAAAAAPDYKLVMLSSTTVRCEGIAKLSWNTTGTRFVTAHTDSAVHVWAVDITYQQKQGGGGGGGGSHSLSASASATLGVGDRGQAEGESPRKSDGPAEQPLVLHVSMRRVSSVHPYHAVKHK